MSQLPDDTKIALQRKHELRLQMNAIMKEIEEIEIFLKVKARMTVNTTAKDAAFLQPASPSEPPPPPLARMAIHGATQEFFAQVAREAILKSGHPLQTAELVEAFRGTGHAIGGTNEWKTASNRLWQAKSDGVLYHMIGKGYWPTDVPYSEAEHGRPAKPKRQRNAPKTIGSHRPVSHARGRPKMMTEEQILAAEIMQKEGKNVKEIALALGGMSSTTVYNSLRRLAKTREVESAEKIAVDAPKSLN